MLCTTCGKKTKVVDVRLINGKRYRRRECLNCKVRFTTYETNFMTLMDLFDEHLPVETVDEISNVLADEMPEK